MRVRRRRPAKKTDDKTRAPTRKQRIRCPKCGWEPDGKKYWGCEKCFAVFDTFKTGAQCPKCPNSWTWTQCIRCKEKSDHEAWFTTDES